jgi:hypothetical protein
MNSLEDLYVRTLAVPLLRQPMLMENCGIVTFMKVLLMFVMITCTTPLGIQPSMNETGIPIFIDSMGFHETTPNRSSMAVPAMMQRPCTLYQVLSAKTKGMGSENEILGG